jgi:hypothetical protein
LVLREGVVCSDCHSRLDYLVSRDD